MFQGKGKFQSWLFRIAYFQFLQYLRSKKITDELPENIASPDHSVNINQNRDIESAMTELYPNERACLTLQFSFGYTQQEISGLTDLPLGTVKSHIKRGKDKLSQLLNLGADDTSVSGVA